MLEASGIDLPHDELWLIGTSIWALVAVQLEARDTAAVLFDRLLPWAGQIPTAVVAASESIDHCLGELAALLGRTADAEHHLDAAERSARAFGSPFYIARTLLQRAELDVLKNRADAQARAAEALVIATEHQYPRLERAAFDILEAD